MVIMLPFLPQGHLYYSFSEFMNKLATTNYNTRYVQTCHNAAQPITTNVTMLEQPEP